MSFRKRLFSSSSSSKEGGQSDAALSLHSLVSKPSAKRKRSGRNKSILSRFVHRVVPCVSSKESHETLDSSHLAEKPILPLVAPPANFYPPPVPPSPKDVETEVIVPPPATPHLLPDEETDGLTSGSVQAPGSTGLPPTPSTASSYATKDEQADDQEDDDDLDPALLDEQAREEQLIRQRGAGIPIGPDGIPKPLLPPISPEHAGRKCLVLDLDETLVHSSFKAIPQPDFIVPVEIEYHWHHFHVLKRPGVDNFLKRMGELYEIVVFTASLSKYADPVLDQLDIHHVVTHRLFRESCYNHKGNYVKDLSQLGRPLASTIILDNSPASYIFHPHNAVPVSSWFNDPHDAELTDLIPFLDDLSRMGSSECSDGGWVGDVRGVLDVNLDPHDY